ncbi:MAG: hypothetical protein ACMUIL_01410 [bacterium]
MDLQDLGISGPGAAMICLKDQEKLNPVSQALKGMGIGTVSQALSQKEALDKMKYNQYDIVIMEDGFGGPLDDSQLLEEFRNMSIAERRTIFLALLGDRWETGNALQAFALSVNLVMNSRILDKLKEGLTSALMRNFRFYKIFSEYRETLGKV